jgi:hypothetical protein
MMIVGLFRRCSPISAPGRERVGDVLQQEQTEDDVLVLGGVDLPA